MAAVVMQEGFAQICLITNNMTIVRMKIDMNIPRKRKGNVKQHEKVSKSVTVAHLRAVLFFCHKRVSLKISLSKMSIIPPLNS